MKARLWAPVLYLQHQGDERVLRLKPKISLYKYAKLDLLRRNGLIFQRMKTVEH